MALLKCMHVDTTKHNETPVGKCVCVCVCVSVREREREREREQAVLDQEVVTVMGWWKAYERLFAGS
jgi:hypothetical protein